MFRDVTSIPIPRLLPPLALAAALALAAGPAWSAWPHDPWVNVQIAPSSGPQTSQRVISDGAGGVIVAYVDARNALNPAIYVQRITASGQVAPGWPADGRAMTVLVAGAQSVPVLVSDNSGGAIVAWQDDRFGASNSDIFAQHVTTTGAIAPGWPAAGLRLSTDTHDENNPAIAQDGAGGAYVAWETVWTVGNPGDIDLYATHLQGNSGLVWSNVALYNPIDEQKTPQLLPDGAGGFVIAFLDNYDGVAGGSTLYAVRAIHFNSGPTLQWLADVSNGLFDHKAHRMIQDGAGGYYFAWQDYRSGNPDVYAGRLTAAGASPPGWFNGRVVCQDTGVQQDIDLASDGNGGAFVVWSDQRDDSGDIYGAHFTIDANPVTGWIPDGNSLCTSPGGQSRPAVMSDGLGGAFVSWSDNRDFPTSVYAMRLAPMAALAPGWWPNGNLVSSGGNLGTKPPALVADATGGFIAVWPDIRTVPDQMFAQRMDHFGVLGNPEPAITAVRDVGADQGGQLRLAWNASWLDSDPTFGVYAYWIWRQVPVALAQAAVAQGARWVDDAPLATAETGNVAASHPIAAVAASGDARRFMKASTAAAAYAWEFVAQQAPSGFLTYSYTASTTTDSMAGSNPRTVFMVQARGYLPNTFWSSAPDSGYSVDNLAPGTPNPFTGTYAAGATHLHWGAGTEPDLAGYHLYRGASAGFVPGPANQIATPPDTGYTDAGAAGGYYKLSAVDVHGNESGFALLTPGTIVGVPGPGSMGVAWLAPVSPNPTRGKVVLRFGLPRETEVRLAIFDLTGRVVAELIQGRLPAGEHTVPWEGRDHERGSASGLFWVRLEAEGRSITRRLVRME
jgi:hypothetical protein